MHIEVINAIITHEVKLLLSKLAFKMKILLSQEFLIQNKVYNLIKYSVLFFGFTNLICPLVNIYIYIYTKEFLCDFFNHFYFQF